MDIKKNITSIFMIPTLNIPKDCLKDNNFINGYIKDVNRDEYKDCVYLLFKPKNLDRFKEFLDNEYERTKDVIEDYDYEKGYVVVVYQLNKAYKKDFNLIKKGMYSKTSIEFQALFPKVIKIMKNGLHKDELSLQYRIFIKSGDLIDFWEERLATKFEEEYELWDGFSEENEILDINKLLEHV